MRPALEPDKQRRAMRPVEPCGPAETTAGLDGQATKAPKPFAYRVQNVLETVRTQNTRVRDFCQDLFCLSVLESLGAGFGHVPPCEAALLTGSRPSSPEVVERLVKATSCSWSTCPRRRCILRCGGCTKAFCTIFTAAALTRVLQFFARIQSMYGATRQTITTSLHQSPPSDGASEGGATAPRRAVHAGRAACPRRAPRPARPAPPRRPKRPRRAKSPARPA